MLRPCQSTASVRLKMPRTKQAQIAAAHEPDQPATVKICLLSPLRLYNIQVFKTRLRGEKVGKRMIKTYPVNYKTQPREKFNIRLRNSELLEACYGKSFRSLRLIILPGIVRLKTNNMWRSQFLTVFQKPWKLMRVMVFLQHWMTTILKQWRCNEKWLLRW